MDYSLLVGVSEVKNTGEPLSDSSYLRAGTPMFSKDRSADNDTSSQNRVSILSIIDYLQTWNSAKTAANCIKSFEHNKATVRPKYYGDRFVKHFENFIIPVDIDSEQNKTLEQQLSKQNQAMPARCFPFVKA